MERARARASAQLPQTRWRWARWARRLVCRAWWPQGRAHFGQGARRSRGGKSSAMAAWARHPFVFVARAASALVCWWHANPQAPRGSARWPVPGVAYRAAVEGKKL